jgi:hypothetical protein
MKVTVIVNKAGKVIAAYIPVDGESGPESGAGVRVGFMPKEDQEVMDLDVPDEEVPRVPSDDLMEMLQRRKDT